MTQQSARLEGANRARQKSGGGRSEVYVHARTATEILRNMIYSLLENEFTKEHVVTALGRLTDEAAGDEWRKVLEGRERAKHLSG